MRFSLEVDFLDAVRGSKQRIALPTGEPLEVTIPEGTADGQTIRLRGKGSEGLGSGGPGDLYARIRIRPHPFFRREGRDLYLDLPVSVREATLGAKVQVPTLEGRVTLTIPPGTDSGSKLRLRGKGVPSPSGGAPGDLYVVVQICVPRDLPPEVAKKLEEIAEYEAADLRKELS